MGAMSPWHWAIVLVALVLLFGSKRLPDAARGVGRSLRIFKSEIKEMSDDKDTAAASPAAPVPPAQLPAVNVAPPVVAPPAAAYPTAPTPATPAATETPGS